MVEEGSAPAVVGLLTVDSEATTVGEDGADPVDWSMRFFLETNMVLKEARLRLALFDEEVLGAATSEDMIATSL